MISELLQQIIYDIVSYTTIDYNNIKTVIDWAKEIK